MLQASIESCSTNIDYRSHVELIQHLPKATSLHIINIVSNTLTVFSSFTKWHNAPKSKKLFVIYSMLSESRRVGSTIPS